MEIANSPTWYDNFCNFCNEPRRELVVSECGCTCIRPGCEYENDVYICKSCLQEALKMMEDSE